MRALMLLYGLQCKAIWRKWFRSFRTVKGALTTIVLVGFMSMMLLPLGMAVFGPRESAGIGVKRYLPLAMFAYFIYSLLSSIGDRALYFSPAEVDHFFPAPFHRKELLAYRIFSWFVLSFLMALLLIGAAGMHVNYLLFGFFGIAIGWFAMTMMNMLISVLGQLAATQLFSKGRKILAAICLVLIAAGVSQSLVQSGISIDSDFSAMVDAVNDSPYARIVLAPFNVLTRVIFARTFAAFATWLSVAVAIVSIIIFGIFVADANYLETAERISRKTFEKASRMQQGKMKVSSTANRWRIGMFPFWKGFGPIAWRQCTEALRKSRVLLVAVALMAIAFSVPLILRMESKFFQSPGIVAAAYGVVGYLMFLMAINLSSGFRADVDHIEVFKSLPLPPFRIAAGELAGSALAFVFVFFCVGLIGLVATRDFYAYWISGFLFAIPASVLHLSLCNILFLHFPVRFTPGNNAGMEQVGQNMISMMALGVVYLGIFLICGIPTGLTFWMTNDVVLTLFTGTVMISILAVIAVFLLGKSFENFDVAKIPG